MRACPFSYKYLWRQLGIVALILVISGCGAASEQRLEREVLSKDPSFADILTRKKESDEVIRQFKSDLKQRKRSTHTQIKQLRKQWRSFEKSTKKSIHELASRFDGKKKELVIQKRQLQSRLRTQRKERGQLKRTARSVARLMKNDSASAEEFSRWKAQIKALSGDQQRAQKKIAELKEELELIKKKYILLD